MCYITDFLLLNTSEQCWNSEFEIWFWIFAKMRMGIFECFRQNQGKRKNLQTYDTYRMNQK